MREDITVITEGDNFYASALRAIRSARHSILIMVYIWQDDEIGRLFERALLKKAAEGKTVRLVVDAIGSYDLPRDFSARLATAGVEVQMHHRVWILRLSWFRYLIRRNHRKILIVDDEIAFTGGFNIMRECSRRYYGDRRWLDMMALSYQKKLVLLLRDQFADACRRARHRKWASRMLLRSRNKVIVSNAHRVFSFSMSRWLKRRLRLAQNRIVIAVPYFVPYGFFWRILLKKIKQGVRVEIILSESSDSKWVDSVSFHMARRLMRKGASVFVYHGEAIPQRFSHTKFMMIDNWVGTGSANYDYRSMVLNLDTLLFFRNSLPVWNANLAAMKSASKLALESDLPSGLRAWLLWPFRWLL